MPHFFLYCTVVFLVAVQCVTTEFKIMPEYKNMNVEKSSLGIVLVRESLTIDNSNDITKSLGNGDAREVFCNFLTSHLKDFAEQDSRFGTIEVLNNYHIAKLTKSILHFSSSDSVVVRVPLNNTFINDTIPFLLILDGFTLAREQKTGKTVVVTSIYGTMGTRKAGAADNLIVKGTFVVWDTREGKIVSFGKINEKMDILLTGLTQQSWEAMVERISSHLFNDVPYGMPSVSTEE